MRWMRDGGSLQFLGLTKNEVKEITEELTPVINNLRKKYERYLDIHESGEATEKQQDLMLYYKEKLNLFLAFQEEGIQIIK